MIVRARLTSTATYSFEYITPRIRITPHDLLDTRLERCATLHLICSPSRAANILDEVKEVEGWHPTIIYEPIPVCSFINGPVFVKFTYIPRIDVYRKSCLP
jgi:hypothetical protein